MAEIVISYTELAELLRNSQELPHTVRGIQGDMEGVLLNVRPLRIGPSLQVRIRADSMHEGVLICPFHTEGHLSWLLRHLVPPLALDYIRVEKSHFVIDMNAYLRFRWPGFEIRELRCEGERIHLVFGIERDEGMGE
jgi:hypothetical protein